MAAKATPVRRRPEVGRVGRKKMAPVPRVPEEGGVEVEGSTTGGGGVSGSGAGVEGGGEEGGRRGG